LLYGGIATLATKLSLDLLTDNRSSKSNGIYQTERSSIGGYILGGVMLITAIPVKIGFSRKIRKSSRFDESGNNKSKEDNIY
jgi:hypothetical protein